MYLVFSAPHLHPYYLTSVERRYATFQILSSTVLSDFNYLLLLYFFVTKSARLLPRNWFCLNFKIPLFCSSNIANISKLAYCDAFVILVSPLNQRFFLFSYVFVKFFLLANGSLASVVALDLLQTLEMLTEVKSDFINVDICCHHCFMQALETWLDLLILDHIILIQLLNRLFQGKISKSG
jgi:hypothetical protein